jgi:signal transduction histidine kinase
MRFSIRTKIFLVILAPSLLLLFVIYLDYRHISDLGRSAELILAKNYKSIRAAQQIRQLLETHRNQLVTDVFLERKTSAPQIHIGEISKFLTVCRENITEPGEASIIDRLFEDYQQYQELSSRLTRTAETNITPPAFLSLTAKFISNVNDLVLINENAMEEADRRTQQTAAQALKYSIGLLIAAIIFIVGFSYILSSKISYPLTMLAQSLSEIREGSGKYPKIPVESQDEIGFLSAEFNRLFERMKIYDQLSQDQLTAEKLKVRRAEEAKAQFIADLSHQLKTPMTSLSMSIGILDEKADRLPAEKREKLIETAKDGCAELSALINELVDITRLEGSLEPRAKELLNIETVIQECLRPLAHQAEEKNIDIEVDVKPGLADIAIDSLRFPWVITNLVGNAIRYTDSGGRVAIRVWGREGRCYFQCIDTGTGIEEKYLPRIFDRYTQFSEREKSGTIGLGLAIVREIIEQHGGDIRVESTVGSGTTFTFWIQVQS